ncbi:MAG: cytochrome c maturation protein CcmE [Flavipsychrobacter sp.]|nr:cytochrome c maturation protein CcmE [Flavipsychrobacter sp.]
MKKTQIVLLGLIAIAIAVIVMKFADFSTYETFASASASPGKSFHVIGYLQTDKPMEYDPGVDPNRFVFYAKDKAGAVTKVIFDKGKPQDIEKSEQIVMKGYIDNGNFHCTGIQMKCPSKYKDRDQTIGDMS